MNLLTIDLEEWYLFRKNIDADHKLKEFDRYLDMLLAEMEAQNTKATFFCLGRMAAEFPEVVKKIAAKGHEIGCHSDKHLWVNKMTREEFEVDTHTAVDALEQLVGEKVRSFRAPAFSIGSDNLWAFEVLAANGIERDASVFPSSRDFGGFAGFSSKEPCVIKYRGISLQEFPVSPATLFGREVVYSGGGYFRFFPYTFVSNKLKSEPYVMTYFHLLDLVPERGKVMSRAAYEAYFKENGSLLNRYKRYLKSNLGKAGAYPKLVKLLQSHSFSNLQEASAVIDWDNVAYISL